MAKKAKTNVAIDTTIGDGQSARAIKLAPELGSEVITITEEIATKKLEISGGPFAVMHSFLNHMDAETVANLPDTNDDTGQNPARYKVTIGDKVKEEYFYHKLALSHPTVIAWLARADMLKRSMGDPKRVNQQDVTQEVRDTDIAYRVSEIEQLTNKVNTTKNNVADAFELYWQLRRIQGDNDVKVTAEIIYALDEKGEPCDGNEGRSFKVDATKTPIVITSTVPGRAAKDTRRISVGSFLSYNVKKAKEAQGGATFQALENTLNKAPPANTPATGNVNIMTVDTFITVMTSAAEYLRRIQEDETSKASIQLLHNLLQADTDVGRDAFWTCRYAMESLSSLTRSPRDDIKWQAMVNENAGKRPTKKKAA